MNWSKLRKISNWYAKLSEWSIPTRNLQIVMLTKTPKRKLLGLNIEGLHCRPTKLENWKKKKREAQALVEWKAYKRWLLTSDSSVNMKSVQTQKIRLRCHCGSLEPTKNKSTNLYLSVFKPRIHL